MQKLRNWVLTCRHRLWSTPTIWYFCPYNPTSVSVSCTHGGVGLQWLGLQCTSICQDLSWRWFFSSLTLVVYSSLVNGIYFCSLYFFLCRSYFWFVSLSLSLSFPFSLRPHAPLSMNPSLSRSLALSLCLSLSLSLSCLCLSVVCVWEIVCAWLCVYVCVWERERKKRNGV